MALPTIHGTGRLTRDPELRFTGQGAAVCTIDLAFNARRRDPASGEWVDGDVLFIRGTVFGQPGENAAESLTRGMEVTVTGRLRTQQWEDRSTGEKRTATTMLIDTIGPSLRTQTAKVAKAARTGGTAPADPGGPAPDPWPGGYGDAPPF